MASIKVVRDGRLTRLILARPDALNAMSWTMAAEFRAAVRAAGRDPSRVLVLSGEGRAFSAGGDLAFIRENQRLPKAAVERRMKTFYGSFLELTRVPKPVVARVHGVAVGAGLCLALASDLRVVEASTRLAFNFVRLGLAPGMAAWPLARARLGEARARELLFLGRPFDGKRLAAWGGAVAAPTGLAALERETGRVAGELASLSPAALRWLKLETSLSARLAPYLAHEARGQADCFAGPDLAEGLAALKAGRAPKFG